MWLTTNNEVYLLGKQAFINFSRDITDFSIVLDSTSTYQSIDGFGAALTGSSAYLINQLSAENRKRLEDLFDPEKGIGINYLRLTIGSSDFSIGTYSYCDQPDIATFAIPERDKTDLLPVLRQILAINPEMKILASPWSAPACILHGPRRPLVGIQVVGMPGTVKPTPLPDLAVVLERQKKSVFAGSDDLRLDTGIRPDHRGCSAKASSETNPKVS